MGVCFRLIYQSVRKKPKVQKLLFAWSQVSKVKLVREGRSVSVKESCVELATVVVVIDERISTLNHDEHDSFKGSIEARVIMVRDGKSFCRGRVPAQRAVRG